MVDGRICELFLAAGGMSNFRAGIEHAAYQCQCRPQAQREGTCYAETPLHLVASSDDVDVLEVLIRVVPTSRFLEARSAVARPWTTRWGTASGESRTGWFS